MKATLRAASIAATFLLLMPIGHSSAAAAPQLAPASAKLSFGRIPLFFEKNVGQAAEPVKFLSRTPGCTLFLTGAEAVMTLHRAQSAPSTRTTGPLHRAAERRNRKMITASVRLLLAGANPAAVITGEDEQAGRSNYFIGNNPAKWRTNIANYGRVRYQGIYPGVDLVYYGTEQCLEHDFIVQPGASVSEIRMRIDGASKGVKLDGAGDLEIGTAAGAITLSRPQVYQENNGRREAVVGRFVRRGKQEIAFAVGQYDHHRPLIIDPLIYSTYLGGSGTGDSAVATAMDTTGDVYLTGHTLSPDFPSTPGAFQTYNHSEAIYLSSAFVTKLNSSGTALIYSTYLGGSGQEYGDGASGLALDAVGNAYVVGATGSTDFPTTPGAFQSINRGATAYSTNGFVAKLNASGSALVYSTYLGGSHYDDVTGIAVNTSGNAYVTGGTDSFDFPTTLGAFQSTNKSTIENAFVSKLNASGTALLYSTYFGGSYVDSTAGIAIDSAGCAYVTGEATSYDFPTTPGAFKRANNIGEGNAFVAKLNPDGTALVYSTCLGGSGEQSGDGANGIVVDKSGNAYLAGRATSTDFPTTPGAFQTASKAFFYSSNAFVSKLNAAGTALVYSTYLGGSGQGGDEANAIAVDASGDTYVTGATSSPDFPTSPGAFQTVNKSQPIDGQTAFVTKLNAAGTALDYSTYLGGSGSPGGVGGDSALAIAVDAVGIADVVGYTYSTDFPTTPGVFQRINGSAGRYYTTFVAKFELVPAFTGSLHTFTASGWHLISSPDTITQSFTALSITAFAYDTGVQNYTGAPAPPADTFHPGRGYWIYVHGSSLDIPGPGTPIDSTTPFRIILGQGWNLVGDPFTAAAPLSSLSITDPSGVSSPYTTAVANHSVSNLFVYDNTSQGYTILGTGTDQLNPWDGAWIYSRQAGEQLVFSNPGAR